MISYKRVDSLLSPAQHPTDVFDNRYCGAHPRSRRENVQRKRHCVCTVYRPPPPAAAAAGLGLSALLRHRTPSALSFTCAPTLSFEVFREKSFCFTVSFFFSSHRIPGPLHIYSTVVPLLLAYESGSGVHLFKPHTHTHYNIRNLVAERWASEGSDLFTCLLKGQF